jgi:hypothetical protein
VALVECVPNFSEGRLLDYAIESLGLPAQVRLQTLEHRLGLATGNYREIQFE